MDFFINVSAYILMLILLSSTLVVDVIKNTFGKFDKIKNCFIFKDLFFYCFIFIILGVFFIFSYYPDYSFFIGDDYAEYLSQANSLLNNSLDEFKNAYLKINEKNAFYIPLFVNWGYCFILAIIIKFFGVEPLYFKLVNFIVYYFALIVFYKICKRYLSDSKSKICSLIITCNIGVLPYIGQVTPDILVTSFFIFSLYFILKIYDDKKASFKNLFLLGFLMFSTFMIKSNGILLIILVVILNIKKFVKEKDFKNFIKINIPIFVFLFGILCFYKMIFTGNGYSGDLDTFSFYILYNNLMGYFLYFIESFNLNLLFFDFPFIHIFLGIFLFLFFIIISFIKKDKFKKFQTIYLFNIIYFISLIVYKFCCLRYIFPILGFVLLQFFYFNEEENENDKKKINILNRIFICWCFSISFIYLFVEIYNYSSNFEYKRDEVYEYIQENTNIDDVFYTRNPRVLYLETKRIGHFISIVDENSIVNNENVGEIKDAFECCDYLLYETRYKTMGDHISVHYLLVKYQDDFELVYSNEKFYLYKRKV